MLEFLPTTADLFSELVTGAIGGLAVTSVAFGMSIYKRRQLERRFPVSGTYISFFEDIEGGERVIVPSRAEVRQRGATVKVVNDTPEGRSWTLDGTILPGGHISGVYSADADYDEGVGSFYLKVGPKDLDGMWSGYDHANRMTTAGRYWFRRMLDMEIDTARPDDVNDILHTSSNAFGYGYTEPEQIGNDETRFAIVARIDGDFAGFCFGGLRPAETLGDLVGDRAGIVPDDIRMADRAGHLGLLKTVAVRRKYRQHGVGTRLLAAAEKALVARGASCILVPAWEVEGVAAISNLLDRADYARWISIDKYWQDACDAGEFQCTARNDACRCGVTFYRKGRI